MSQDGKSIKIVGVGGSGANIVGKLIGELSVEFINILPTLMDAYSFRKLHDTVETLSLQFYFPASKRLSEYESGFNLEDYVHEKSDLNKVKNIVFDGDISHVIIVAGFGGSFSAYITQWLALLARKSEISVTVICTIPFYFEGDAKRTRAINQIRELIDREINVVSFNAQDITKKFSDLNLLNCFEYLGEYMDEKVKEIYNIIARNTSDLGKMEYEISQIAPSCDLGLDVFDRNGRMTTGCIAVENKQEESSELPVNGVPIIGVSRHRIGTDGDGITTLVAFHGCPLRCKFCLNPECWDDANNYKNYTPQSLYDEIIIDDIYFRTTGGGVTFGGGEPCLQADFIVEFRRLCGSEWKIRIETSLNVEKQYIAKLAPVVDEWIIDIKADDEEVYKAYTGESGRQVKENLSYLTSKTGCGIPKDRIHIRVPAILGYLGWDKALETRKMFIDDGYSKVENFSYIVKVKPKKSYSNREQGKRICSLLKEIRKRVAEKSGLIFEEQECTNEGPCQGTCPACDRDLQLLNKRLFYYSDSELPVSAEVEQLVQEISREERENLNGTDEDVLLGEPIISEFQEDNGEPIKKNWFFRKFQQIIERLTGR